MRPAPRQLAPLLAQLLAPLVATLACAGCQLFDQAPDATTAASVCPAVSGPWKVVTSNCFQSGDETWTTLAQDGCTITGDVATYDEALTGDVTVERLAFVLKGVNLEYDCSLPFVADTSYTRVSGACKATGIGKDSCDVTLENTDPPAQPDALDPALQPYSAENDPTVCAQMCQTLAAWCPQTLTTGMDGCQSGCETGPARITLNDVGCLQSLGSCNDPLHVCDTPCGFDCACESGNRVQLVQYFPVYGGCPPADGYCPSLCKTQ